LGFMVVCFVSAALGAAFTRLSIGDWYQSLRKPAINPPDWVFGPVWTILYFLMALAAWLGWRSAIGGASRTAMGIFATQLVLNIAWTGLFFALRSPGAAFLEILLLWLTIAATLRSFLPVSTTASLLLVPYLLWVSYAAVLNFLIWRLNS